MTSLRVLVVDDEPDVRLLLRLQLETNGHHVTGEAADGEEALAACRLDPPDIMILDLLMPGTNGFEVIPRLRADFPDVAVIAYTAVAGDFVRNEMARLRIPLVLKTAHFAPLERALRAAMDQRSSTDPSGRS
ncbi:MAG: two component transcriptional regulator, LuxR family [Actinomycetia bacterium]|jgi:two-component system nitrate/nitrite response regulator NarL|nr:two component transcriptional regulator, LuxR family [Actinomycetes bacterium]